MIPTTVTRLCERCEMPEEYHFLDLRGDKVFSAHHFPTSPASRAIVMCHPLGEEKLWSHRVFVTFAREMAAAGFAVLRFDFRGEGDSSLRFEQSDFETRIVDTSLAIDSVRGLNPSVKDVSLVGLRLGASVAAETASRRSDVARLVLWDPVVDGSVYMQGILRLNLMSQMALHRKVVENRDALVDRLARGNTVNIEGYQLGEPLFRQVSGFRLQNALAKFPGEVVAIQINQGDASPRPELAAATDALPHVRVEILQEDAFWREIRSFYQRAPELTRATLKALGIDQ